MRNFQFQLLVALHLMVIGLCGMIAFASVDKWTLEIAGTVSIIVCLNLARSVSLQVKKINDEKLFSELRTEKMNDN